MDVRVTVSGLESETVTTMTFRNPNARQLAGDFEFPLPDGAVVAGYALDVDGRMVDGVRVTKQKARVVLETEMRRRVDPGLVEHVRGNVFRTRIFPLPAARRAHGPRRHRRRRWRCRAAMPRATCRCRGSAIPTLAIHVEVVKGVVKPQLGGLRQPVAHRVERPLGGRVERSRPSTPGDDLYIRLPKLPTLLTAVEEFDGERYRRDQPRAGGRGTPGAAPVVARAAVAWDASGSRAPTAVRRDRELLAALLATPGWHNATIDLVVFRDRPETARSVRGARRQGAGALRLPRRSCRTTAAPTSRRSTCGGAPRRTPPTRRGCCSPTASTRSAPACRPLAACPCTSSRPTAFATPRCSG